MSSSGKLILDDYVILTFDKYVPEFLMVLFRQNDKEIISVDNGNEVFTEYKYKISVLKVRDRLRLLKVKSVDLSKLFYETIAEDVRFYDYVSKQNPGVDEYTKKLDFFKNYGFDDWKQTLKLILKEKIYDWNLNRKFPKESPQNIKFFFDLLFKDRFLGLEGDFFEILFFVLLNIVDQNSNLILDYSELVEEGYYSPESDLCEISSEQLSKNFLPSEKIIVLTEGRSDRIILEESFKLIYPHLNEYIAFLNFDELNIQGSANSLVHMIKSFAGAGIKNEIVAIFDNDTAAEESLRSLEKISLPKNIRFFRLPYLSLGEHYPTVGAQGMIHMNINGLACSIELYLEPSTLLDNDGSFIPIQWKGYSEGVRKYQGEVLKKVEIQKKYLEILKRIENGESKVGYNFSAMESILKLVCGLE